MCVVWWSGVDTLRGRMHVMCVPAHLFTCGVPELSCAHRTNCSAAWDPGRWGARRRSLPLGCSCWVGRAGEEGEGTAESPPHSAQSQADQVRPERNETSCCPQPPDFPDSRLPGGHTLGVESLLPCPPHLSQGLQAWFIPCASQGCPGLR